MVISGCLAVVCVLLAFHVWAQDRNLRAGAKQLRERLESDSLTKVDLVMPNRAAEELLAAVNYLKESHNQETLESRKREQALRRQIANVSHDLRTPLTSISGYLQLLQNENLTQEERQEYLHIVMSRSETLGTLISTFYELSRIESGDYPISMQPIQLGPLLRRLIAESWSDFEDAGIVVEADLQETVPPILGDEHAVLRILTNLLGNAGKHAYGSLTVRLAAEGGWVVTTFSNPTVDLTEEDANHVFERSYTGDKMRSGRNTGLGLAIVKALAERMGHAVSAYLRQGVFTIEIRWRIV